MINTSSNREAKMTISKNYGTAVKIICLSSCIGFILGAVAAYCVITLLATSNKKQLSDSAYTVVKKNSHDAAAWAWLGFCLYQQKHYNDALNAYHKAISIDSQCAAAYIGIGTYYVEVKNDDDEAFRWIKKSLMCANKETTEELLKFLFNKRLCRQCQASLDILKKNSQ